MAEEENQELECNFCKLVSYQITPTTYYPMKMENSMSETVINYFNNLDINPIQI